MVNKLILLLLPFHLMAIPAGVNPSAQWNAKASVWVLEANGFQTVWYAQGNKKSEGPFVSGQRTGAWKYFFENGKLKGEGVYGTNLKQGAWKLYHTNGKLESEGVFHNDARSGRWTFYDTDGAKSGEGDYRGGMKEGPWVFYYPGGQISSRGNYRAGEASGFWEYFFKKGQPFQSGNFQSDVRIGTWNVCVGPQGPCGKEIYNPSITSGAPRVSGLDPAMLPSRDSRATRNPAGVLDSMEGEVPDQVPASIQGRGHWND